MASNVTGDRGMKWSAVYDGWPVGDWYDSILAERRWPSGPTYFSSLLVQQFVQFSGSAVRLPSASARMPWKS